MKKLIMVAALAVALVGCTDAEVSSFTALGDKATITCWSGGQKVYENVSTGKVMQLDGDGISFRAASTDKYVRAFADCIVEEQ